MSRDDLTGDEPLADGMHIVIRLRRDFTVTGAHRLPRGTACTDNGDVFALPADI